MGLGADAELIYGIPVTAFDENEGEPTGLWSEEDEDWRSLPGDLDIHTFGHYEDPDNQRGILTLARFESYSGDCWEPVPISAREMDFHADHDYMDELTDELLAHGLDEYLNTPMGWYLVASYG